MDGNVIIFIASILTAITVIGTTIIKLFNIFKTISDRINTFQQSIEENTMYILKLVVLNEDLSLEERIHAGDRYIQLHGNGYVHTIYDQLKREVEKEHEHNSGVN